MAYRNYSVGNGFTVATDGSGDFTTIAAALTASVSGTDIFIRPGTYSENLTLKAGVNLVGFTGDSRTPTVTILGKCTATYTGTSCINNIELKTNADFLIVNSGSNATSLILLGCVINCIDNTGISHTNSNASSNIIIENCIGKIGTTGITYFVSTATSGITVRSSSFGNSGGSTTPSTTSVGSIVFQYSLFVLPASTTGTGIVQGFYSTFNPGNNTVLTTAGTGTGFFNNCKITSGTATALSIGTGTSVTVLNTDVASSNTNAISGAGTLIYGGLVFSSTSVTLQNTLTLQLLGFTPANAVSGYVLTSTGTNTSPTWQSNLVNTLRPAFSAYLSTSATNVTGNGTTYTIIYNNTDVNNTASFSTGTGLFTAPITGNYLFSYAIYLTTTSTWNNLFNSYLIINGTNSYKTLFPYGTPNTSNQIVYTALVPLTAGQTVGVGIAAFTVANTLNTTVVGVASPLRSNLFSGYLVS